MRWLVLTASVGCSQSFVTPDALFGPDDPGSLELAESLARDHLELGDHLVGVDGLELVRTSVDETGRAHVRFSQSQYGLPVFGAMVSVHLDADGTPRRVSDDLVRYLPPVRVPALDAAEAIDRASAAFAPSTGARAALRVLRLDASDHLAWEVELPQLDGSHTTGLPHALIDADTGEVLFSWDDLQTVSAQTPYYGTVELDVEPDGTELVLRDGRSQTWDLQGAAPEHGAIDEAALVAVRSVDGTFEDGTAVTVQWATAATLDFYEARFGRLGLDGDGGPRGRDDRLVSAVHYGEGYANAFWTGERAMYGDGDGDRHGPLVPLDVVAHELTHGVVDFTADLLYFRESGALNESFADVMGALTEEAVLGSSDMWTMAERSFTPNIPGDAMRYLSDPTRDGSSKDHYARRYTGPFDNGGVHSNSGIPNLAFHLVAEGGQHSTPWFVRRGVQGIGTEAAGRIWYTALAHHLHWLDDFADARQATLTAARDLYGEGSFEEEAVANAWAEVGVGDPFGGPMPEDELPPQPVSIAQFTDLAAPDTDTRVTRTIVVPAGTAWLIVKTSGGTGDADLYVNHGEEIPRWQTPDCRSWEFGNTEECVIEAPASGTWFLTLGTFYSPFSEVTLEAWTVAD